MNKQQLIAANEELALKLDIALQALQHLNDNAAFPRDWKIANAAIAKIATISDTAYSKTVYLSKKLADCQDQLASVQGQLERVQKHLDEVEPSPLEELNDEIKTIQEDKSS